MNINTVTEIIHNTHVFFGIGAIQKIDYIVEELKKRGVTSILCMTGRAAYEKTGAWKFCTDAFAKHGVKFALFNKVSANPNDTEVDEAVALGKKEGCNAVIGIGGGSPLDAGKSAAILLSHTDKTCANLYKYEFTPEKAVPFVAINLTHGTGSEANRFAVVSVPKEDLKPAIATPLIYPAFSIDDPALMTSLPEKQTLYVSVDAVNHVTEASTTTCTNPFAYSLARETVQLVAKYLPIALKDAKNLEARYWLAYAAMLGGVSFDNGFLHYTHALEHPISALKPEVSHALGLGVLLPAVIEEIYPVSAKILAELYAPIVPGLKGEPSEAKQAADGVRNWLKSVGLTENLSDLGFTKADVPKLVKLTFSTPSLDLMLGAAPTKATEATVEKIYTNSL
ncbi:putative Long-chain primary alcohol dehydrogenase AdhA [Blattamonas nauphoetae]|uniref:Long-chain primary alcohol dehydrogenase AdhA n=1 Tax=Blattamonas nauphoetae TaxID=2049346 RepID=A0ABQ9XZG1_9EUKA|nr:putative Long-chain primary alcohol dehydrogenase AdhA [Blattamonas nauphoetae]